MVQNLKIENLLNKNISKKKYLYIFFLFSTIFFIVVFLTKLFLYLKGYSNHEILMYSNALWNTNLKNVLVSDLHNFYPGQTLLLDHFYITFLTLFPIYKLFPTPITLLLIQTLAPIISGYLILLICKELKINSIFSLVFSLVYIFNIVNVLGTIDGVYGFHVDCLIPIFFFLTYYAFLKKNIFLYSLSFFLLLGVKEDLLIYSTFICLLSYFYFIYLKKINNKFDIRILNISILISFLMLVSYFIFIYYWGIIVGGVGPNPGSQVITNPYLHIFEKYSIYNFFLYFFSIKWLIIILSFFPALFGFPYFILAYPFVYNLGSWYPNLSLFSGTHYTYHWFIVIAIIGFSAIKSFNQIYKFSEKKRQVLISLSIFFFALSFTVGFYKAFSKLDKIIEKPYLHNVKSVDEINKLIPEDAYLYTSLSIAHKFVNRLHLVKLGTYNIAEINPETGGFREVVNEDIEYLVILKKEFNTKNKLYKNFVILYENQEIIVSVKKQFFRIKKY